MRRIVTAAMVGAMVAGTGFAQDSKQSNYDEAKVPEFEVPQVLETFGGKRVKSVRKWEKTRRPELLDAFAENVYGRVPQVEVQMVMPGEGQIEERETSPAEEHLDEQLSAQEGVQMRCEVVEESDEALQGRAIRRQVLMTFTSGGLERKALMLIYLPREADGPVPVFTMLNFNGNEAVYPDDPDIIHSQYSSPDNFIGVSSCPVDMIVGSGYGLATVHYWDFFPDKPDGHAESVLPLLCRDLPGGSRGGSTGGPGHNATGSSDAMAASPDSTATLAAPEGGQAIACWAWGYSRMLDYLLTDPQVDGDRVIIIGHSRLGKTTLWAGAQDQRFAMVVLNEAGCGGAALSKRCFGERVNRITTRFPHWFSPNFHNYAWHEEDLPIDQHEALALIAPRPLYVASAEGDRWSDPRGEYLSAVYASQVYRLYGYQALDTPSGGSAAEQRSIAMPPLSTPIHTRVGYHIRPGKHDMLDYDWQKYITFATLWLTD